MRKNLLFATFFLFLLPVMEFGDAFTLSAQNMAYENGSWWLPEVDVVGRAKELCPTCGNYYYVDEQWDHVCTLECEYCYKTIEMDLYDDHIQREHSTYCMNCGQYFVDEHNCEGNNIPNIGGTGGDSGNGNFGWNNGAYSGNYFGETSNSPYKQFGTYEVVVNTKLLKQYLPQSSKFDCVHTAMEYAANILDPGNDYSRKRISYTYDAIYPDADVFGVPSSTFDDFVGIVFEFSIINSYIQFKSAIDNHFPVIGHISGGIVPYKPMDHMILAIGYNVSYPYSIICIDPQTGSYISKSFMDFNGNIYKLEQVKETYK